MLVRGGGRLGWGRGGGWMCNRRDCGTTVVLLLLLTLLTCAWIAFVVSSSAAGSGCCSRLRSPPSSNWSSSIADRQGWDDGEDLASWAMGGTTSGNLSLRNIVFGIAGSAKLWPTRKEFIRLWWRPKQMRGFVWHEDPVEADEWDAALPPIRISQDTSAFRYTNVNGHPAGIRIARIVQETFRMNLSDVQWFVLCDDDTIFSVENLVHVLGKYDPGQLYYVGGVSESHRQNVAFSHNMAYGGGGFAISYPLAKALAQMQDKCLQRYPDLTGSDDRLHACISELGVPLTREPGFHQMDIYGNPLGLLSAHPVAPFVSMHHVEAIHPVFPDRTRLEGLQMLSKAMRAEPSNFLQQAICYDEKQGLSFSISPGYVVQVFEEIIYPRVLEKAEVTFKAWNSRNAALEFDLDTRLARSPCKQPFLFFLNHTYRAPDAEQWAAVSEYKRHSAVDERKRFCWSRMLFPGSSGTRGDTFHNVQSIRVVTKPSSSDWYRVPRRRCCHLGRVEKQVLNLTVAPCEPGETLVC